MAFPSLARRVRSAMRQGTPPRSQHEPRDAQQQEDAEEQHCAEGEVSQHARAGTYSDPGAMVDLRRYNALRARRRAITIGCLVYNGVGISPLVTAARPGPT